MQGSNYFDSLLMQYELPPQQINFRACATAVVSWVAVMIALGQRSSSDHVLLSALRVDVSALVEQQLRHLLIVF